MLPPTPVATPREGSPPRFYVPQLDGLRFVAFLLVFLHHAPRLSGFLPQGSAARFALRFAEENGWLGVDLFLVLSAFLITSLLLREHAQYAGISLRRFYLRRVLRIWPLYYLMIALGFFVLPWLSLFAFPFGSPEHVRLMKNHLLPFVTLFGNLSSGLHGYATVATLGHLWTITLEEQFYVVWPVVLVLLLRVRLSARWRFLALASLLIGTLAVRLSLRGLFPHPFVWTNTLARLDPLLVGIALALWRHAHPARAGWAASGIRVVLGILAVASIAWGPRIETQSPHIAWQFLATAAGFGLILDAVLSSGRNPFSWLLSRRALVWLGRLTYGLYVYHVLALQIGRAGVSLLHSHQIADGPVATALLGLVASLLITIAIAAVSYRLFESYFLRLKDRFSRVESTPIATRAA